MNQRPAKRAHSKLSGKIKTLAQQDIFAAAKLALRGREFTPIEEWLDFYYLGLRQVQSIRRLGMTSLAAKFKEHPDFFSKEVLAGMNQMAQNLFVSYGTKICAVLLRAIEEQDAAKIFEIGKAVQSFKTSTHTGDQRRAAILVFKTILDKKGEKWPIKKLAQAVQWPNMKTDDGFAQLRRICKELKFPLAPSRNKTGKT